jgi:hypothetical protein
MKTTSATLARMLLLAALSLFACAPEREVGAEPARPNLLLILTDDQDRASLAYMPNVRTLLRERA